MVTDEDKCVGCEHVHDEEDGGCGTCGCYPFRGQEELATLPNRPDK